MPHSGLSCLLRREHRSAKGSAGTANPLPGLPRPDPKRYPAFPASAAPPYIVTDPDRGEEQTAIGPGLQPPGILRTIAKYYHPVLYN